MQVLLVHGMTRTPRHTFLMNHRGVRAVVAGALGRDGGRVTY